MDMITVTRYPDGSVRLDAALDRMAAHAPTLAEAYRDLSEALGAKRRARQAHRFLVSQSAVGFDPREHIYVAECPAAGVRATGFTRQDAWFRLLHGLELRAEELAAEAEIEDAMITTEDTQDVEDFEIRSEPVGLDSGGDSGDPDVHE